MCNTMLLTCFCIIVSSRRSSMSFDMHYFVLTKWTCHQIHIHITPLVYLDVMKTVNTNKNHAASSSQTYICIVYSSGPIICHCSSHVINTENSSNKMSKIGHFVHRLIYGLLKPAPIKWEASRYQIGGFFWKFPKEKREGFSVEYICQVIYSFAPPLICHQCNQKGRGEINWRCTEALWKANVAFWKREVCRKWKEAARAMMFKVQDHGNDL